MLPIEKHSLGATIGTKKKKKRVWLPLGKYNIVKGKHFSAEIIRGLNNNSSQTSSRESPAQGKIPHSAGLETYPADKDSLPHPPSWLERR